MSSSCGAKVLQLACCQLAASCGARYGSKRSRSDGEMGVFKMTLMRTSRHEGEDEREIPAACPHPGGSVGGPFWENTACFAWREGPFWEIAALRLVKGPACSPASTRSCRHRSMRPRSQRCSGRWRRRPRGGSVSSSGRRDCLPHACLHIHTVSVLKQFRACGGGTSCAGGGGTAAARAAAGAPVCMNCPRHERYELVPGRRSSEREFNTRRRRRRRGGVSSRILRWLTALSLTIAGMGHRWLLVAWARS